MILLIIFIVLSVIFAFITGFSKAVADLSEEGKLKWTPSKYWLKHESSENKNKYTGEVKKFLMRTIFVMFTDGWHKYEFYLTYSLLLAGYFVGYVSGSSSSWYSFLLLGVIGVRMGIFHLFHDTLNILKQDKFHTK